MLNNFRPGSLVYWHGKAAILMELRGLSEAIIRLTENFQTEIVPVAGLSPTLYEAAAQKVHHTIAEKEDWQKAVERFEYIRPLLEMPHRTIDDIEAVAHKVKKSPTTIYRWLMRFEKTGLVSALIRTPRSDKGGSRLSPEQEQIVQRVIETEYLTDQRKKISKVYDAIKLACEDDGLVPPNRSTIYQRINTLSEQHKISTRVGKKAAKEKFGQLTGRFPGGDYPLAVVQIDHTPMDVIVLDEEDRLPIGRPFLTFGLDVNTKMCHGFCITLEHPSTLSVALCVAHGAVRKDEWLAKRDIFAEWPIYGKPRTIHTDNAKEFIGKTLARACQEHGIKQDFRPPGRPNYGPNIERAFRTFMSEVHTLPGTTFSSVAEKMSYDSEGRACLTLSELELWFTVFIVYVYHQKPHKGISDIPPINLYSQAVHGTDKRPGVGLPLAIPDEDRFRLDFTPYVMRVIQRDGVAIDYITYQSPVLRKWVDMDDPETGKARKFHFARDPRDISVVYFLDPDTNSYVRIPYADSSRPPISLWELKAVVDRLKEDPVRVVNEALIFQGIKRMRQIESDAIEKTRLAKNARAEEKRKRKLRARRAGWQAIHGVPNEKPNDQSSKYPDDDGDIQPFDVSEMR
jgi:putative transposase